MKQLLGLIKNDIGLTVYMIVRCRGEYFMEFIIEKLEEKHQKEVTDILNYYIENTTTAYRSEPVSKEFANNFIESSNIYCSFIIKTIENKIIGFCTLEPFKSTPTFSEVAEAMYFIHHEYTGHGAGTLALNKIEDEAKKIGIKKLVADISTENSGSIKFHLKNGFVEYGRLCNAGYKFGRTFGIAYFVKEI